MYHFDGENPVVQAIKAAKDAVVSVSVTKELPEELLANPPATPYGLPSARLPRSHKDPLPHDHDRIQMGGGSGFIVTRAGLVLTNKHVVRDPEATYSIVLASDKILPAKIVSRDPTNDIAVLRVSAEEDLPTVGLGDSSRLELGETLIAIGNALGTFKNTVSVGVVSGLSRALEAQDGLSGGMAHLRGLIQTDAAINPGNSGGPLVNIYGEAVGVNVATVMGAENIGFAIPINIAKNDLADIERYGRIRKPFLGVRYLVVTKDVKEQFGLPIARGALILPEERTGDPAVVPQSPAVRAGLAEEDLVLEFNGIPLDEKVTLEDVLERCRVGERVKVRFLRQGRELETEVLLEERLA